MPNIICGCGKSVETKPEWAGQWISCPGCNGTLYAPFPGDRPAPPIPVIQMEAPVADAPPATRLCPWCAETIPAAASTCPVCKGDANAKPTRPASLLPAPATAASTTDPGGMAPLVVGIIGFMFCQLLAPVAWAMGSRYEKDCRARGLTPNGMGTAGKILGIVGCAFLFLTIGIFIVMVIVGAATS